MRHQTAGLEDVPVRIAIASLIGAAAASAAALALVHWGRPEAPSAAATPEELVSSWMIWAAVALCGWLGLGSFLTAAATLPGAMGAACDRAAGWVTPRLLRQAVAAAIGTTVTTLALPVGPAHGAGVVRDVSSPVTPSPVSPTSVTTSGGGPSGLAKTSATPTSATPATVVRSAPDPAFGATSVSSVAAAGSAVVSVPVVVVGSSAPDPGWRPSPPVQLVESEQSRLLAPSPRSSTDPDGTVTVRRGDTLWHIAARHLGPGASDAEIALEWPRWYTANRAVIGPEPDRLLPGQLLRQPAEDGER